MVVVEVEDVELLMTDVVRVMQLPLLRMDGCRRVDGRRSMVDGDVVDN